MAGTYPEVSSKVCHGPTTVVIWKIGGWGLNKEQDPKGNLRDLLQSNVSCYINVNSGPGFGGPDGIAEARKARLRFYFADNYNSYGDLDVLHLDLKVEELFNLHNGILKYIFKVEAVDDQLKLVDDYVKPFTTPPMAFYRGEIDILTMLLQKKFIKAWEAYEDKCIIPDYRLAEFDKDAMKYHPRPEVLRLKISVTPIFVRNDSEGAGAGQEVKMKDLLGAKDQVPASKSDPKLETKVNDGSQPSAGAPLKVPSGIGVWVSGRGDSSKDMAIWEPSVSALTTSISISEKAKRVEEAGGDPQNAYPDANQLFVGNLPHFVIPQDMIDIFAQFGELARVSVQKPIPKPKQSRGGNQTGQGQRKFRSSAS